MISARLIFVVVFLLSVHHDWRSAQSLSNLSSVLKSSSSLKPDFCENSVVTVISLDPCTVLDFGTICCWLSESDRRSQSESPPSICVLCWLNECIGCDGW